MKRKEPRPATTSPAASVAELGRAIRRTSLLDAALKRHWLAVLPQLTPADRARLAAILGQSEPGPR